MVLIHLIKHTADQLLPRRHQVVLALMLPLLLMALVWSRPAPTTQSGQAPFTAPNANPFPVPLPSGPTNLIELVSSLQPPFDDRLVLEVGAGDNLSLLFARAGLDAAAVHAITSTAPEAERLAALYPGNKLAFDIRHDGSLASLELIKSPLESHLYTRHASGAFDYRAVQRQPQLSRVYKEAEITDSLFQAAQRGGIPAAMAMELAGIFGGVIDFILDTRVGDTFNVIYEEQRLNGEFIGHGRILAAQFTNQGQTFTAIRYENALGETNFYSPEGESMRKAFLLNPVDFTRISSGFSLSRKHPILNTIRAHKGTDYAAPRGTPVVATSDGRVTFAGRRGSFGKLVVLQHGDRFETKYAHLNEYAKGVTNGARVKQGQVIGYVGATGSATGPHLHYEFLMDGVHRNSRTIHNELPRAESVAAAELPRFREHAHGIMTLLASKGSTATTLAQAGGATGSVE